jgi:hypothetical protein
MQGAARGGRCRTDRSDQEVPGAGWHLERAEPHADWTFAVHARFRLGVSPIFAGHKGNLPAEQEHRLFPPHSERVLI